MALSDLAVFSEYAYDSMNELLAQQIELFNAASRGSIVLQPAAHQGDYSDRAFWARIDGLIRRRNAYGTATIAEKDLAQLIDTMVKVAAGTPPVRVDPGQFRWIQQNSELGGVLYGRQLAEGMLQDMLNTGLMCVVTALTGAAEAVVDATGGTATQVLFNTGQRVFGDRSDAIGVWVMHSKPLFDIYGAALANTAGLFTFGTVNIKQDAFGRPFIISDSPSLTVPDGVALGTDMFRILGLTDNAIVVHQNNDFDQNMETSNGRENIIRTIQSEWSYNLGVKGFAWDKTNGGKSPNDAALAVSTNWDRYATSVKDLAGVLINTQ